jgi:DNA mismatch repair ATPase MutL
MTSRLTILTRTQDSQVGYMQSYKNGVPVTNKPKPQARQTGTTITVQDLFYNVPHRKKTYSKSESDEYQRILLVVQQYSMYYPHVGFCCSRTFQKNKKLVDLNTAPLPKVQALMAIMAKQTSTSLHHHSKPEIIAATKQVMAHVLESTLEPHLDHLECHSDDMSKEKRKDIDRSGNDEDNDQDTQDARFQFSFSCQLYYSLPSYDAKQQKGSGCSCILFVNDRLVDVPPMKRALEEVYQEFTKHRPIFMLQLQVPGSQVDVNVHPSKRQVALMYQDELIAAIRQALKEALLAKEVTFQAQSVKAATTKSTSSTSTVSKITNPYHHKRKSPPEESQPQDTTTPHKPPAKKKTPPSQLIRTSGATPVGAIEPFLVSTQTTATQQSQSQASTQSSSASSPSTTVTSPSQTQTQGTPSPIIKAQQHKTECPTLSQPVVDMSQPGAFASLITRCDCPTPSIDDLQKPMFLRKPVVRPKRVIPTKCSYASVVSLRKRVNKKASTDLAKHLRDAYFVGTLSHDRSLVQCGEELVLLNHMEMAKALFYQLALARFGGGSTRMAHLGNGGSGGVHIQSVIAQALQVEDDLVLLEEEKQRRDQEDDQEHTKWHESGLLEVSETNDKLAEQAATCLLDNADMLEEYLMIRIEKQNEEAILTGLPVLLDGHAPEPHGLPIFLLRLATQVDWAEERLCFQGVCQELGNYYALLPSDSEDLEAFIKHTLFPAISYLLLPAEHFKTDGSFTVMTKLSTLYKVFERC